MSWIVDQDWHHPEDRGTVMLILQRIMRPTSIRGEALNMHNTILGILGRPLWRFLTAAQARDPTAAADIEPLLERLQGCLDFHRARDATLSELQAWYAPQGGSIPSATRSAVSGLIYWSAHSGLGGVPAPSFGQRHLRTATTLSGARTVLDALVDEIRAQSALGLADAALDVCAALVLASTLDAARALASAASGALLQGRLSLHDALQAELHDAPGVRTRDVFRTETLVRLGRRVAALGPAVPGAHGDDVAVNVDVDVNVGVDVDVGGAAGAVNAAGHDDALAGLDGDGVLDMAMGGMHDLDAAADAAALGFGTGAAAVSSSGAGDVNVDNGAAAGAPHDAGMQLDLDAVMAGENNGAAGGVGAAIGGGDGAGGGVSGADAGAAGGATVTDDDIFGDLVLDDDMQLDF